MANGDLELGLPVDVGSGYFQRVFALLDAQEAAIATPAWVHVGPHEHAFLVVDAADANNVAALDGGVSTARDTDPSDHVVEIGTLNSGTPDKIAITERWPWFRCRKTGVGSDAMTALLVVTYRR